MGSPPWEETAAYRPGNAVQVLVNGPQTYRSMYQAIAEARHHIHVQTYILCNDEVGRRFTDALISRRRDGVAVRLLFDSHGTLPCSDDTFLGGLAAAGLELIALRPASAGELLYPFYYNHRDHRKLLIVDGRVAFTGGINFDAVYATNPRLSGPPDEGWRDTNVRIEGPAVADFQALFLERWRQLRPLPEFPDARFFPPLPAVGDSAVRVLASVGGQPNPIYEAYLNAIRGARERVWLTHSYLGPEPNLLRELAAAAARGVDVRLVLPGFSDVPLLYPTARAAYGRLLAAGVRLYERHDAFVHAKTATVDGFWSTIGSFNLDYRSLVHNDEVNALILDPEVTATMEALFLVDVAHAEEITAEAWGRRPLSGRALEWLGLLLAYWL